MSEAERASGGRLPLDEWLTRYDDALLRGETPPDLADADGSDADRLRDFLDMLDRTLRPKGSDSGRPCGAGEVDATGVPSCGTIGRFVIEEELGRGGFGIVFRAFDPAIGRRVALKVPRVDALTDPDVRRRFLREAHAAAQLDHPNLVPVFEVGEEGSVCYIASAYCEGPTLRRWMDAGGAPSDAGEAARLTLGMARAVEHMHRRGVLHCDLKPGNVLLDLHPAGEPTPRVTDFGLARLADAPIGDSTAALAWGTPPYMAPEQIEMRREAVGPATDVYALGAVLYELLTGRPPHRGETIWELMRAVTSEPPVPPRCLRRSIPRDLDAIAMRCLEKRPGRRYEDASALVEDLTRHLERRPTLARPLGRGRRLARWSARNRAASGLLAMGAAMLAVSIGYTMALRRAVDDLNRANTEARDARGRAEENEALAENALARAERQAEKEREAHYVATLSLAQQEMDRGRLVQAQRILRDLVPPAGAAGADRRDFAWHYLWRQSRRESTVLDDLSISRVASTDGLLLGMQAYGGGGVWRISRPTGASHTARETRPDLTFVPHRRSSIEFRWAAPLPGGRLGVGSFEERDDRELRGLSVFDLADGSVLESIEDAELIATTNSLSGDGRLLAVGTNRDGFSKLNGRNWDFGEGALRVIRVPGGNTVAFTGDGRRIASLVWSSQGHDRNALEVWDVKTGEIVGCYPDPVITALAASPRPGGRIATGTLTGEVQIREPGRGKIVSVVPSLSADRDRVSCLAYSPDGKTLAVGYDGLAVLLDLASLREIARIERLYSRTASIAFLHGPTPDLAICLNSGEVVLWHLRPIEPAVVLQAHDDQAWGLGYAQGGRVLASVGGDKFLKLWDAENDVETAALPGHQDWPSCLAAATFGDVVATGDFGGEVLIWDARERRLVHKLEAHEGRVRAVALSGDGRCLASAGRDRTIRLWDAATGALAGSLDGHEAAVRGLAFRADGRMLASVCEDESIRIWDVPGGRLIRQLEGGARISCVAWSPDGRVLGTGDVQGAVTLWDAESGQVRACLSNLHRQEVSGLAFSPDGRVLAVAGQDKLITLVDVATGRRHLTLAGHEGGVNALAFSPDGFTLASASHDKTVRLWWAGPAPASTLPSAASGL